ncbi:MAG: PrsW family intramembrane metalloprotease [Thermoplasmata archaeon]|nr:PrsW family intramembrane metalloprotease [Thermoplasmata archaeon]MCI4356560.1 PrsW family intramembrane metalloprotease [Thermoplasmata archaeon]
MVDSSGFVDFLVLTLAALLPALAYLVWVRQSERLGQEPWGLLLRLFLFGALGATIIAGVLEVVILDIGTKISLSYPAPEFAFLNGNSTLGVFFLVLVIAPFVEEGLKAAGVVQYRSSMRRLADGPVFGAAVGLGFGFFETLLYGLGAFLAGGLAAGLTLIFVRSISSVLLHGSSTAMFGRGYASNIYQGRAGASGAYYLLAVGMHASFNALASLGAILLAAGLPNWIGPYADVLGLLAAIAFAFGAIEHVRTVIAQSDFPGASAVHPRYRPPSVKPRSGPPPRQYTK